MLFRRKSEADLLKSGNYSEFIDRRINFLHNLILQWKSNVKSSSFLSDSQKKDLYSDVKSLIKETEEFAVVLKRIGIIINNIGSADVVIILRKHIKEIDLLCIGMKHICENIIRDLRSTISEDHYLIRSLMKIRKDIIGNLEMIPAMVRNCSRIYDERNKNDLIKEYRAELHILLDVSNEEEIFVKNVA
jgi:hypothetical protein